MAENEVFDVVVMEGKLFDVIGVDVNDAKIAQAKEKFMPLTIRDINDKAGIKAVHDGRMIVRDMRILVEKHAKKVREKAVKFQKDVIAEEKRVIALIQPIEDHLSDEENRVAEELARLRAEAAAKEASRVKVLVDKLYSLGCRFDGAAWTFNDVPVTTQIQLIGMPEEQFAGITKAIQTALDEEKAAKAAEAGRIAKVAAEQEQERLRLARIAAEQEAETRRLAAESKALQDEKDGLAREAKAAEDAKKAEEEAKQRAEEMEKAKAEAAEKARIETEERIKREAAEKEAREKAEAEEKARKEEAARIRAEKKTARLPDKDKLMAFTNNFFREAVSPGEMKTEEGISACDAIWTIIQTAEYDCREIVERL
jgi:hypothetical protein